MLDQSPIRGLHALLEPLNELAADAGAAVAHPAARELLASLTGSSNAAKLAKALLARDGASRHADAAARQAAEARIERARRWAAA